MEDKKYRLDIVCASTDTVSTENLSDGSTKYLVDTKVLYIFYNENWYEV